MNTKHTPGPWRINEYGQLLAGKNGIHLFHLVPSPGLGFAQDANAYVIAAAPEMLALLEKWVAEYDVFMGRENDDSKEPEYVTASRAVIAKAKG